MIEKNFTKYTVIYFFILFLIYIKGAVLFKLNPIFLILFFLVIFFQGIKIKTLLESTIFISLLIIVTFFTEIRGIQTVLYFLNDILLVFFILFLYSSIMKDKIDIRSQKEFLLCSSFYIIVYLISAISEKNYDYSLGMARYNGITGSANVSSMIFLLLSTYIFEYVKIYFRKYLHVSLIIFSCLFAVTLYFSRSRSLAFFLPYIFFQFYYSFSFLRKRIIILALLIFISGILYLNSNDIMEILRINQDTSFNTRKRISEIILEGIKDNYFIIPHGHNQGNLFLAEYLGEERYPIHNDFFKIIYDWGAVGIVFIAMTLGRLFWKIKNLNDRLILLFFISGALHNILYLFYIWIPLLFIFCLKNSCITLGEKK